MFCKERQIERHLPIAWEKLIRRKIATRRISTGVEGNELYVSFQDGPSKRWTLPERTDKFNVRRIRDEAVTFAAQHGATKGQQDAVKKALTQAEYWLTK